MKFKFIRRQQFLVEADYVYMAQLIDTVLNDEDGLKAGLQNSETEPGLHADLARGIAFESFTLLCLEYTVGKSIELLREQLEQLIEAYERYSEYFWAYQDDSSEPVLAFGDIDEYAQLMQIIGLCFLLHRRDLLPRIAALQDGAAGENGGADALFEEFMIHALGANKRYHSDFMFALRPYESLFYAMTEDQQPAQLKELNVFLKRWYKDLTGCGWHDSHKLNANGDQGGYYGYWSFEAGAAVILLGIEDDSSLHQYLYYPKDLVAWSREHAADYPNGGAIITPRQPSVEGGNPCPKAGWWFTPAKADSLRYFEYGEIMPNFENSEWGSTHWQLGSRNMEP